MLPTHQPGGPSCRSSSTYAPERNTKSSSRTRSHRRVAGWLGPAPGARVWLVPPEAPYFLGDGRDGLHLVEHDVRSRLDGFVEIPWPHGRAQYHHRDAGIAFAQLADQNAPVSVGQTKVDHRHVQAALEAALQRLAGLGERAGLGDHLDIRLA